VGLPFGSSTDTCPVRALRQWLDKAEITEGPVFRSVDRYGHVSRRGLHRDSIGKLLKRGASRAGLKVEELGGHSLRASSGLPSVCRALQTVLAKHAVIRTRLTDSKTLADFMVLILEILTSRKMENR